MLHVDNNKLYSDAMKEAEETLKQVVQAEKMLAG